MPARSSERTARGGGLVSVTTTRRDDKRQDLVKAIVQDRFGPPEVMRLADTGASGRELRPFIAMRRPR